MTVRASLVTIAALALFASACKGKGDKKKGADNKGTATPTKPDKTAKPTPKPAKPPGSTCSETNAVEITFSDKERGVTAGKLAAKTSRAFVTGMWRSKTVAKYATLAVSNASMIDVGRKGAVRSPTKAGEMTAVIAFKTDDAAAEFDKRKEVYSTVEVPGGAYEPGWGKKTKSVQVNVFVGGAKGGPAVSDGATGTATLTSSKGYLCGSLDLTSAAGSTLKGTFNVKLEGDLWAKAAAEDAKKDGDSAAKDDSAKPMTKPAMKKAMPDKK